MSFCLRFPRQADTQPDVCAVKQGNRTVTVPFNRQQMADYLSVDRSALSGELSKMQKEGVIAYEKNRFTVL